MIAQQSTSNGIYNQNEWLHSSVVRDKEKRQKIAINNILVALVLVMSRTRPGLVPTVPVLGQCSVYMRTQDRLQNGNHGSITCPSCPETRLCQLRTKNKRAIHGPKITVADQK